MEIFQLPAAHRVVTRRIYYLFGLIPIWESAEDVRVYEDPSRIKEPVEEMD